VKRFLVLASIAVVFNRQAAFGTLMVVVPANGGFVVAADTRTVFVNTACDGATKIVHPKQRRNTVVLAAGTPAVIRFDKPPSRPCEYLKSGPRMLDIPRLVSMRLDAIKNDILSEAEVNRIANDSFLEVKAFEQRNRKLHPLNYYIGIGFQIDIISYDEKHATVLIGGFAVRVDSTGTPELLKNTPFCRLSKADKLEMMVVGDKDFAHQYIRTTQMQAILGKPIGQVSLTDATSAALQYIIDGEKATEAMKEPDVGIGGPIDVATITRAGIQIKRHSTRESVVSVTSPLH
jgi:hypothetical protein